MRCGRCGYNNYPESQYCKRCWAELYRSDDDNDSLSKYKNASNYQNTYSHGRNLYDGNNRYIKGLYSIDTNNNYNNDSCENNNYQNNYNSDNYTNDNYSGGSYINDSYANNDYQNNNYSDNSYTNDSYANNDYQNNSYSDNSYTNDSYANNDYQNNNYSDNSYANNNEQNSSQNSTQYNNANTQYSHTANSNEQYNSGVGNAQPVAGRTYNYYTEKSVPTGVHDAYRYNSCSSYNGAEDEESKRRKRRIRNVRNTTTLVVSLAILLFAGCTFLEAIVRTSGAFSKPSELPVAEEIMEEEATQPTIPEAKLDYSLHSIKDDETGRIKVSYHPPKGYYFIDNGIESIANFESEIYYNTVSLTTMFFSGDLQKEIDYYKSLEEREGTSVEVNTASTNLGEMTEMIVSNRGKGLNYQLYIKISENIYLDISMTNIPFEYAEESTKLLALLLEDLEISYLEVPTEVATEITTEITTE